MTFDYDAAEREYNNANPEEGGGSWMEAGEHTC